VPGLKSKFHKALSHNNLPQASRPLSIASASFYQPASRRLTQFSFLAARLFRNSGHREASYLRQSLCQHRFRCWRAMFALPFDFPSERSSK
jgi:hypothetical protein